MFHTIILLYNLNNSLLLIKPIGNKTCFFLCNGIIFYDVVLIFANDFWAIYMQLKRVVFCVKDIIFCTKV